LERVVIGLFFTGVKLSDGNAGVCYTPIKTIPEAACCPSSARAIRKAVGIATLNALSAGLWERGPEATYALQEGVDALDTLELGDDEHVVVVGALAPFLKALKRRGRPHRVLGLDPTTLKPDELPYFAPAVSAPAEVPLADVLAEAGSGFHFFGKSDERIVARRRVFSSNPHRGRAVAAEALEG
jgi:uncharacterized protein (DUF4213/DUF364 family)